MIRIEKNVFFYVSLVLVLVAGCSSKAPYLEDEKDNFGEICQLIVVKNIDKAVEGYVEDYVEDNIGDDVGDYIGEYVGDYVGDYIAKMSPSIIHLHRKALLNKFKYKYPLHYAAFQGDKGAVLSFIEKGADVNEEDGFKRTPLHWLVYFNIFLFDEDEDMVKLLLEKGANPNVQDQCGNTPVHYISEYKDTEVVLGSNVKGIVKALLENEGDVYISNKEGVTPYDVASKVSLEKNAFEKWFFFDSKKLFDKQKKDIN